MSSPDPSLAMPHTALHVLGPVRWVLAADPASAEHHAGVRREQALLALLAAEARPLSRARLTARLWPDADEAEARARLRRLLHAMSGRFGVGTLVVTRQDVRLAQDLVDACDLAELRRCLARGLYCDEATLDAGAIDALQHAAALGAAPFAEGLELPECEELQAWLERQRESLRQARLQVLSRLARVHERRGQTALALPHAQALVDADPLDESAQRLLAGLLAATGRTQDGLRQLDACRELLRRDLDVEPEAATEALANSLRATLSPTSASDFAREPVRYTRSADVHLAYQLCGEGPVDVIFISGFLSHLEQAWEPGGPGPFFAALASRARLILFDRRGVGLSDRLSQRSTLDDNVDDVLAVLDAAGSRQAVVFAISEGGPIGIRLAARHPESVRALALWGTLAKGTADERHPWALTPAQYQRWLEGLVAQWGQPTGIEAFAPGHERNPLLRRWWARTLRLGGSPGSLRALLGTLAQVDVRAELANVHVPTLVMHRTEDRAVRVEAGRHVAQGIAGARFLELPGNEHWFWLGDTTLALQALTELLR